MSQSAEKTHGELKRAMRIAMRTLRRRATAIGETQTGEPIVRVAGVQLVLPAGASNLHLSGTCVKCGVLFVLEAARSPTQLNNRYSQTLCAACATISVTAPAVQQRGGDGAHHDNAESVDAREERVSAARAEALSGALGPDAAAFDPPATPSAPPHGRAEDSNDTPATLPPGRARPERESVRGTPAKDLLVDRWSQELQRLVARVDTAVGQVEEMRESMKQGPTVAVAEIRSLLGREPEIFAPLIKTAAQEAVHDQLGEFRESLRTALDAHRDGQAEMASRLTALARQVEEQSDAFRASTAALQAMVESEARISKRLEQQAQSLGARLQQERAELLREVVVQLESTVGEGLVLLEQSQCEQLRKAHDDLGARLVATLGERFDQQGNSVAAALDKQGRTSAARLEENGERLAARLEESVGGRLDAHRRELGLELQDSLEAAVADVLERHRLSLRAELAAALGTRLDEHRAVLRSELHSSVAAQFLQDRDRHAKRLEAAGERSAAALQQALLDHLSESVTEATRAAMASAQGQLRQVESAPHGGNGRPQAVETAVDAAAQSSPAGGRRRAVAAKAVRRDKPATGKPVGRRTSPTSRQARDTPANDATRRRETPKRVTKNS